MAEKERVYRLGMADPRSGPERIMGMVNKAFANKVAKKQHRSYDDSPEQMRKNLQASRKAEK